MNGRVSFFDIIDKESQMATLVFDRSCALKIT